MYLRGKVAIVTGGSRGIGKSVIDLFFSEGAVVINGDLSVENDDLKLVGKKLESSIFEGHLDVSLEDSVNKFINSVINKFNTIDILVNNAGICRDIQDFEKVSKEEWNQILNVNLMGTVNCTKAVIPIMKKNRTGKIINIASIAGEDGARASSVAYTVSKAGIIAMTKVLARQLGPFGINVNSVAPGYIVTEMTKTHVHHLSNVPLGRRGVPEDVAKAVLFLASDMSSYITGTTLDVNGGVYMK